MIRRFIATACAVGMMIATLSACGSSGSSGGTEGEGGAGDAGNSGGGGSGTGTIRLGLVVAKAFTEQTYYTAQQKGYFKDNGVTVKVTTFQGGADAVKAFAAGQIDVIVGTGFDSPAATAKGVPLKVFASVAAPSPLVLVAGKNSGITSMKDIEGKRLGITRFGSLTDYMTRYEARHAGLDPETGIKQVPLGGLPAQAAALTAGSIDAFNAGVVTAIPLVNKGQGKIVGKFRDINDNTEYTVLEAAPKYLESHQKLIKNFLSAFYKGINYLKKNKDWGVKATAKTLKISKPLAEKVYGTIAPLLNSDGSVNTDALKAYAKAEKQLGIIKTVPKLSEFYTGEFVPVKPSGQ